MIDEKSIRIHQAVTEACIQIVSETLSMFGSNSEANVQTHVQDRGIDYDMYVLYIQSADIKCQNPNHEQGQGSGVRGQGSGVMGDG